MVLECDWFEFVDDRLVDDSSGILPIESTTFSGGFGEEFQSVSEMDGIRISECLDGNLPEIETVITAEQLFQFKENEIGSNQLVGFQIGSIECPQTTVLSDPGTGRVPPWLLVEGQSEGEDGRNGTVEILRTS